MSNDSKKDKYGCVYLMVSESYPCWVKIGKYEKESAKARENQLNNASENVTKQTIKPLSICYSEKIKIKNLKTCERHLHDAFAFCRIPADIVQDKFKFNSSSKKPTEFFKIDWRAIRAALLFMKTVNHLATVADQNNSLEPQPPSDSLMEEDKMELQQSKQKLTRLMSEAILCNIESVEKTLQKSSKEDIDMQRSGGRTALMWAIDPENKFINNRNLDTEEERRPIIVEKIISYADIEITTDIGKTALMIAAKHGKDYAVELLLLKAGAGAKEYKNIKCHGGWTALDYALAYEHKTDAHKKIISLLRE